jgi:hypothetical protein
MPGERDYIQRELDMFFSTYPGVRHRTGRIARFVARKENMSHSRCQGQLDCCAS